MSELPNREEEERSEIRVLVIDDHVLLGEMVVSALSTNPDFSPELATTAAEALSRIKKNGTYDAILLDYDMPGTNGLSFLRKIIAANNSRKDKFIPALVAGLIVFAAGSVHAETATGEMGVSAEVSRTCTLSAAPLAFGTLSADAVTSASAVVTLVCNGTSTVTTILVGMGANPAPPTTQRNMISGTSLVPYTLHVLEAGGADIATAGAVTLVKVGTTNTYNATLYGKIQPSTDYAMGSYSDTVILTAVYLP